MRITELNNCIEEMRKCYDFKNDETEIRIGRNIECAGGRTVEVATIDKNGTRVLLSRREDELSDRVDVE